MLDELITGATLIDGTGAPARRADIGLLHGRIATIAEPGAITDAAERSFAADGLMACPGFIDPHTHYDAQLLWDPYATPSNVHGVTTVIAGNCGFTLAPIKADDADYTRRMMAKVEGMPLAALENGIDWNWESFAEYLNRLDGRLGVNAGFLIGHCALRRYVMGDDAIGHEAAPDQIQAMVALLRQGLESGGLGFSTTLSRTHNDGDGEPVASRWASRDELLALCAEVGRHEGTTLEGIVDGCLEEFTDDEIDLLVSMSAAARRPLNWNVLTVDSKKPDQPWHQLEAGTRAAARGARVVALTMPVQVPMNMSFGTFCALNLLPGWGEVLGLPRPERIAALRDPATRTKMLAQASSPEAGVFARLADFANYVIGDTYSPTNDGLKGRVVAEIAAERGTDAFDTLVEIAIADDLRTVLWPIPTDGDDASWELRRQVWDDPRAMLGGSDAGAHLDRMCGAPYPTRFLGDCLRGRRLVSVERAVQMMTSEPADLFGLRHRGVLTEGAVADLVLFDPEEVGATHATLVDDLPGGTARLTAQAIGIRRVYVAGVVTVEDNVGTGELPGQVLRAGIDTDTVATDAVSSGP